MPKEIVFRERQKTNQWWIWLIMVATNILILYGMFELFMENKKQGINPLSSLDFLIVFSIMLFLNALIITLRMDTYIDRNGIYFRYIPFRFRYKFYSWEIIEKAHVRKYSPTKEFGGWGYGKGLRLKNKAYNMSGNMGLQLEFYNGAKILLGTNREEELTETLKALGKHKESV